MTGKPLVIFGLSEIADVAFSYFSEDSEYDVVAYTVDAAYRDRETFHDVPVVPYEDVRGHFDPAEVSLFVAASYGRNNRVRAALIERAQSDGWTLATYVASRANVWASEIGRNCMIIDTTAVQAGCVVGDGSILWTNTMVGERTRIGACCYIGPTAIIGGNAAIGDRCVIGPLAHVASHRKVGDDCFIGATARVYSDAPAGTVLLEPGTKPLPYTTYDLPPVLAGRLYHDAFGR